MQWHECNKHNYLCINDSLKFLFPCEIRVLQSTNLKKLIPGTIHTTSSRPHD
jgi:hypothetical protein